jgi:ubiquinone/menaquinone biosynthesis C-methylase UbiE/DNA-binding MarR family transcriptional regulator
VLDAVPALAALSDPLRLRAIRLLSREGLQVREIQRVLGAAQSRVSNHLGVLRRAGLVETRRQDGHDRYRATAEARRLWESLAGSVRDEAFPADDATLADVILERSAFEAGGGFDDVAPEWDRIQAPFYTAGVREAALMRLVPRDVFAADIGCGTGLLTLTLARAAGRVIAVDASARMVRLTREKVVRAGLTNVEVRKGRAESLPAASASIDAAFAFHLLRHLAQPADAVGELARILKPGGRVVLVELEPHGVRADREATGSVHLGLPRERVRAALVRAGFATPRFEALAEPYRVPGAPGNPGHAFPAYIADAVRGQATPSTRSRKKENR